MAFTVQAWRGETKAAEVSESDLRHARHTATQWRDNGFTTRILWGMRDWTEVYAPDGSMRAGRIAETTYVH